jgi:hypothetical protein
MSEFSLRALAREVWDDLGGCDYHILAKEIQRRISAADRDAALAEALAEYSRQFAVGLRPTLRKAKPGAAQRNSGRSAKVAGIRRSWPQLRAHIFTRDGQKALGKCTAADLIFHADLLERQSRQLQAKASRERDLAALLRAHQVERVENLPDTVLSEYFSGDEAAA